MSTIFALSSGALPSAIAVFRLSGQRSLAALQELSGREVWKPKHMRYTKLYNAKKEILDTAMAVYLPGPSTFTGEDTSEIFIHGSVAVAEELSTTLLAMERVRQAKRGEFSKRAFFNGKMNLSEVKGLRLLIESETSRQRRISMSQMRGGQEVIRIRDQLQEVMMRTMLLMDFGEHVDTSMEEIHALLAPVIRDVSLLCDRSRIAEVVQRGLKVVLLGKPNVGKSSIMNFLARRDVAIVSSIAGTTRDSLSVRLNVSGVPLVLCDTAGVRSTDCEIEIEGIKRARMRLREADIVLLVVDNQTTREEVEDLLSEIKEFGQPSVPIVMVRNKADLPSSYSQSNINYDRCLETVKTSATNVEGVSSLLSCLKDVVSRLVPSEEGKCLADHKLLDDVYSLILRAADSSDAALVSSLLEESLSIIGQMTGDTVNEQLLNQLFQQFCIGK